MPASGLPPNAAELMEYVDEALHGLDLEPEEASEILGFANGEVPHLQTPETSYLVLGSFRSPYERRLRIVENELNKRLATYACVLGDLRSLDVDRLPTFRIRFYIIAPYVDGIAAVYEQDAGGEVTELGKISETPFFEDSYVLPRDYAWMTDQRLESVEDVYAAAVRIAASDTVEDDDVKAEIDSLVESAQVNGVTVTSDQVWNRVEERQRDGPEVPSYSWVHLNEFRLFELHGQCFPWSDLEGLRSTVDQIP